MRGAPRILLMRARKVLRLRGTHSIFDRFAGSVTRLAGSSWAFTVAVASVAVWAAVGPAFRFSEDWQMVINTGTTIVTFLMVFLIQQSQNKDSLAVHIKLNELLASQESASNHLVAVEDLDEADLATLRTFYCKLAALAKEEANVSQSHSLDDARIVHASKARRVAPTRNGRKEGIA
jgi:low affinity Fe/Cu permease